MGFFERPDPRLIESADPSPGSAIGRTLLRHAAALALGDPAATAGTLHVSSLRGALTIVRDRRDIPHIRASNDRDLFFAEGFAEGSDRLFQLDLTRRYAYGRLAEILGPKALPYDEAQRAVDIDGIEERQLRALARS